MKRSQFRESLLAFWAEQEGVTAIEYALIGALIAVVIAGSVGLVGQALKSLFDSVVAAFP